MTRFSHPSSFISLLCLPPFSLSSSCTALPDFISSLFSLFLPKNSHPLLSPPYVFFFFFFSDSPSLCVFLSCRAGLGVADVGCVCLPGLLAPSPEHPTHQPGQVCPGHMGCKRGGGEAPTTNIQWTQITKTPLKYIDWKCVHTLCLSVDFWHPIFVWYHVTFIQQLHKNTNIWYRASCKKCCGNCTNASYCLFQPPESHLFISRCTFIRWSLA